MPRPSIRDPSLSAGARAGQAAVRVKNFTRRFGDNAVLDGLNLQIEQGEFVALLGRSGSGKTTLLRTLAGLDPAGDQDVSVPAARAVVFQEPRLLPWKRVWHNVALGLQGNDARRRAEAALAEVGLAHRSDVWPGTLSGGEAQRAALARALVREPRLLLLNLWGTHAPAVLIVTHDVDEAISLADRVLVLEGGRIAAEEHIDLRRPRDVGASFQSIRRRLLGHLGVEQGGAPPPPRTAQDSPLVTFPVREITP